MTQIFLFQSGGSAASWPDPGNWNPSSNKIECLGNGYMGKAGNSGIGYAGGGGGGGAYAFVNNTALTFPVNYFVAPASSAAGATSFGSTSSVFTSASICSAQGGYIGIGGGSGSASNGGISVYPAGFVGGNGGGNTAATTGGNGGGGAAGPHGAGGNGANGSTTGGAGGAADNNTTAGGAAGVNGSSGTQWDASHGCGSGGGGAGASTTGAGAAYGGGGGGGSQTGFKTGGAGADGLIIITYTALTGAQLTQELIEEWAQGTPQAISTKVIAEEWATVALAPVQAQLTQSLVEEWATVALAPTPARLTQILIEEWGTGGATRAVMTQVLVEEWGWSGVRTTARKQTRGMIMA